MAQETETVAIELNFVSCQTCDALFIGSERREMCPFCGGPPVGPYFQFVLDGDGLRQVDGAAPAAPPAPEEEEEEAPAAMTPVVSRAEALQHLRDLGYSPAEAERRVSE